jgi:hypothetical protein
LLSKSLQLQKEAILTIKQAKRGKTFMANSLPKQQTEIPSPIVSSEDLGWQSIIVEEYQQPHHYTSIHRYQKLLECLPLRE